MGQVASLFYLTQQDFQQLNADPTAFDWSQPQLDGEAFCKTFEGLRFVLSKGRDAETIALIEQIFEPHLFVGEALDYETIDWSQVSDTFPFDAQPTYYNPPETVDAIAAFLATVTDETFRQAFDPDELNHAEVYPGRVWNRETAPDIGYNERAMLAELQLLQNFFARIQQRGNYCVCFIG